MPFPYLRPLLEPLRQFLPYGGAWSSVGASRSYEIFTGCAETLGGILLLAPRTATLGALVCLADMIQVFILNMTYDVPVKPSPSSHTVFPLPAGSGSTQATRLLLQTVLLLPPTSAPLPFCARKPFGHGFSSCICFYLIGMGIYSGIQGWHTYGGGRPKSALYGIWNVDEMSVDGQLRRVVHRS